MADETQKLPALVAIVRADTDAPLLEAARALLRGGIMAMEVTLTTPGALASIETLRRALGETMHVGVGTVLSPEDAQKAVAVGAQFVVTPTLQLDTIAACRARAVPVFCGAYTPTECLAAHAAGADFVKLFPADGLGPAFVKALLAPLPFLKIVPTGGVSVETIGAFRKAGCVGAAVGSQLVSREILAAGNWEKLEAAAAAFMRAWEEAGAG